MCLNIKLILPLVELIAESKVEATESDFIKICMTPLILNFTFLSVGLFLPLYFMMVLE